MYDIPYMWEARECLRKKLIGKKVSVQLPCFMNSYSEHPWNSTYIRGAPVLFISKPFMFREKIASVFSMPHDGSTQPLLQIK